MFNFRLFLWIRPFVRRMQPLDQSDGVTRVPGILVDPRWPFSADHFSWTERINGKSKWSINETLPSEERRLSFSFKSEKHLRRSFSWGNRRRTVWQTTVFSFAQMCHFDVVCCQWRIPTNQSDNTSGTHFSLFRRLFRREEHHLEHLPRIDQCFTQHYPVDSLHSSNREFFLR